MFADQHQPLNRGLRRVERRLPQPSHPTYDNPTFTAPGNELALACCFDGLLKVATCRAIPAAIVSLLFSLQETPQPFVDF